ncbi:MAG: TolC family protein, partial [Spirochaetaceae bacterium]
MKHLQPILFVIVSIAFLVDPLLVAAEEQNGLELTLDQVVQEVVLHNPLVREARLEYLISRSEAEAQWGTFEPEMVARYDRSGLERENSALQELMYGGTEFWEKNDEYGLGIEGTFFTGGTYRIGYSLNRMNNSQTALNAERDYETFLGISAEQPLLKGLTHGAPTAGLRAARQDRFVAFHTYRKQLMETVTMAESVYWNLAFAQEEHGMMSNSVEIARRILEDSRERVKAGKMTELDLMEAEAELHVRLSQLADAEQNLFDSMVQLKLLLFDTQIRQDQLLIAADPIYSTVLESWNREEERSFSLIWALRAQPDFMMRLEELQRERIILGFRQDQRLPELNLKASAGFNGLGDSLGESMEKIGTFDYPAWSLGLELRIPMLLGISEKSGLEAAILRGKLAEARLEAMEYEIMNSIETLLLKVTTLRSRVENANKVVEFRKSMLDAEMSRLEAGKSTSRLIYAAEEELTEARRWELESIAALREAMMQLAYFRGSVLLDKGFENIEG